MSSTVSVVPLITESRSLSYLETPNSTTQLDETYLPEFKKLEIDSSVEMDSQSVLFTVDIPNDDMQLISTDLEPLNDMDTTMVESPAISTLTRKFVSQLFISAFEKDDHFANQLSLTVTKKIPKAKSAQTNIFNQIENTCKDFNRKLVAKFICTLLSSKSYDHASLLNPSPLKFDPTQSNSDYEQVFTHGEPYQNDNNAKTQFFLRQVIIVEELSNTNPIMYAINSMLFSKWYSRRMDQEIIEYTWIHYQLKNKITDLQLVNKKQIYNKTAIECNRLFCVSYTR